MQIEIYKDSEGKCPFKDWLTGLKDKRAQLKVDKRLSQLELGNMGDFKSLGGGLLELRIHFGPGYRVYCFKEGQKLIILLSGGDKATQQKDIEKARIYLEDYRNG